MSTYDGGPVFPTPVITNTGDNRTGGYSYTKCHTNPGLSVRDLYAGLAMCLAILEDPHRSCEKISRGSQLLAQAMIDEQPKEDDGDEKDTA